MKKYDLKKLKKVLSIVLVFSIFAYMFANPVFLTKVYANPAGVTVDNVFHSYVADNSVEIMGSGFSSINPATVSGTATRVGTGEILNIVGVGEGDDYFLELNLDASFALSGQYVFAISAAGDPLTLPNGGNFMVLPHMTVDVSVNNDNILVTESNEAQYGWNSSDVITVSLFRLPNMAPPEDISNLIQNQQLTDTTIDFDTSQVLVDGEYYFTVEKTVDTNTFIIGIEDFWIGQPGGEPEGGITGSVVAPDGITPVGGGYVEVLDTNKQFITGPPININGTVTIGGLNDGTYKVVAKPSPASGFAKSNEVTITISGGVLTSPEAGLVLQLTNAQFIGNVTNADQVAVGGGGVDILREFGEYVDHVQVGQNGAFAVGGLVDGRYKLKANPPDGSTDYASSEEVFVEISGGALLGNAPVLVLTSPQVSGRVFQPDGVTAIAYGYVEVKKSNGEYIPGAQVDGQGSFRLGGLSDGTYKLKAMQWGSNFSPSSEATITITNGIYSGNDIVLLLSNPQVTGTVVNPDTTVVQDAWIDIMDVNGMYMGGSMSNQQGVFNLGGLSDGTYKIKANPSWNDKTHTASSELTITISSGTYQGDPIVLTLNNPQISGTVHIPIANGGTNAQNGYLEIRRVDGTWLPGVGIQNGSFAIGGLTDGIYIIQANPDWNSPYIKSDEFKLKILNGVLTADAQTDYNGGPIDLYLRGAQLSGTVKDPLGNLSPFGWIEVKNQNGEWMNGTPVGENGQFGLGGLDDGTYKIIAWPGYGSQYTASEEAIIVIANGLYSGAPVVLTLSSPQIVGEVVSPDGTPQAFGYVEIRNQKGMHMGGSGVDQLGNFSIGGLEDGTYYLKANPDWNSAYSASSDFEIKILNGEYSGGDIILVLKAAQLTGTVTAPDGQTPVNNGWVSVDQTNGRWVTGAPVFNGEFRIGSLDPGTYTIKAYPGWDSEYGESQKITFTIDANGNYQGSPLNLQLSEPQITGVVLGPIGDNTAQPYGFVEIRTLDGMWMPGTGVNDQGEFRISGLEPGTYTLKVVPGNGGSYSASSEVTIVIDNLGNYTGANPLNIRLSAAQITGTVKDPQGNSVQFGFAEVMDEDGMWVAGTSVDYNGQFRLGGLEDGTYYIKVYPDYMNSDFSASLPVEVVIAGGVCTTNQGAGAGNITVNLSGVQLSGTVVAPNGGNAIQNGWVEIQKLEGENNWQWSGGTGINWDGEFSIGGLSDGTYRIKAFPDYWSNSYSASDYLEITVSGGSVTLVDGQNYNQNGITVTLTQAQIEGTIQGPNGESVMFGWIEVKDNLGNYVSGTGTKGDGSFTIGGLSDGTYTITAYPGWMSEFTQSQSVQVVISGSEYAGGELVINLQSAQVVGTVTEPDGETPVEWGWIEVYDANDSWVTSTGVDQNGNFRLSALDDGNYKIQAFTHGDSEFSASQKVSFTIENGTYDGILSISLTNPTATGSVLKPDGSNATSGWIEIGDENENWLFSVQINKEGTFKLPALQAGEYTIQAFAEEGSPFGNSLLGTLTVSGDGSIDPDPLTLQFTNP